MDRYTEIMDIFMGIAGVYMLYAAVTGRGSLFKTENIKKELAEPFKKYLRLFCWFGGIMAIANALLDYFGVEPFAGITLAVLAVFVVALMIFFAKFSIPKKK
ncbi:MAG: hypothetical protein GX424_10235 [Clostridiales bacterium]|nr:hypothetical protein [Clostridiales bacterium]